MSELRRFLRYTTIGAAATATHYAVLVIGVEYLRVAPTLGTAAGAVSGALVSYGGNRRYTFRHGGAHRQSLPRFAVIAMTAAALNSVVLALVTSAGWWYLSAQLLATALVLVLGFFANRLWTFA